MTFRQALNVVWRQRLLVVVVVLLAMGGAGGFLVHQTPVYTSSETVRLSPLAATASTSGQIGTAAVDFDPQTITSADVLGAAAKRIGEPASSSGSWNVTSTLAPTTSGSATSTVIVTITADAATATRAQKRVGAVASSYDAYLVAQTATARSAAEAQLAKSTAQAETAQALVNKNPTDSIAQSSLAAAVAAIGTANGTISSIDSAGRPVIVTKPAAPGDFQGTTAPIALAIALVSGLIAGIGIALIRDAFDDRLRPEDDIEELTGVPPLGELSLDRVARRGRDRLPAAGRERTTLNEGFRSLRTTVQVLLPPGPGVLVVTSVEPGDGKTFISSNLAVTWARMGKRVVLIGGDLRRAGLEQYFGDPAVGPGLTGLLETASSSGSAPSAADVGAALNATAYPGLSLLPSGEEPWDPSDLLAHDALGEIIAALRELCDIVVIDSPPSLALVDARLLSAHADGVIVVASMRRTHRRPLVDTVHALTGSGVPVMGVVVNRSKRALPRSYSTYYGSRRVPAAEPAGPLRSAVDPSPAEDDVATARAAAREADATLAPLAEPEAASREDPQPEREHPAEETDGARTASEREPEHEPVAARRAPRTRARTRRVSTDIAPRDETG